MDSGRLRVELHRMASKTNILYAFVCDGEVKYIGKTTGSLSGRMGGYRSPGRTATTNLRNNANIRALLEIGGSVDIFALPDDGLLHYGQFHLNLAAGLEDDLIRVINPEWNGGQVELQPAPVSGTSTADEKVVEPASAVPPQALDDARAGSFEVTLHTTYYHQGFFNVRVPHQHMFGGDGEPIEVYVSGEQDPIPGMINRTANTNGTPRIMGGRQLRDWFYEATEEKGHRPGDGPDAERHQVGEWRARRY